MLQFISIALTIYSFFMVRSIVPTLPARIPMHFNAAGFANGWGSPQGLWLLFGAQALCCAIFLLIPFLGQLMPGAMHFGRRRLSDCPESQRPQVLLVLNRIAGWMNVVMNLLFADLLRQVIAAARETTPQIHPILPLVLSMGCMAGILIYFAARMRALSVTAAS